MNEIVIQLCAMRTARKGAIIPTTVPFSVNPTPGIWDDYLVRLWPNDDAASEWPPAAMLRQGSFKFLAYRVAGIPSTSRYRLRRSGRLQA